MKTRLVIGLFVFILCALSLSATAQAVQFVKDWEAPLYPDNRYLSASMCVDSEHNVHVVTNAGGWSTVDSSGKVVRTTEDEALRGASSVACIKSDGRVVIAVPRAARLYVFSGDHRLLSSVTVPDGLGKVVSADDTSVRVLAPHQDYLFKDVDIKTGLNIGLLGSRAKGAIPFGPIHGDASMDEGDGVLLFITPNPETVSAFDRQGNLISSRPIVGDIRERDYGQSSKMQGTSMTRDRAFGIFRLADNRYIVNILRADMDTGRKTIKTTLGYQILDAQFNVVGHASIGELNAICDSDGKGAVYSIDGGSMLTIAKAHLK